MDSFTNFVEDFAADAVIFRQKVATITESHRIFVDKNTS